jgi:TolB-like protein
MKHLLYTVFLSTTANAQSAPVPSDPITYAVAQFQVTSTNPEHRELAKGLRTMFQANLFGAGFQLVNRSGAGFQELEGFRSILFDGDMTATPVQYEQHLCAHPNRGSLVCAEYYFLGAAKVETERLEIDLSLVHVQSNRVVATWSKAGESKKFFAVVDTFGATVAKDLETLDVLLELAARPGLKQD